MNDVFARRSVSSSWEPRSRLRVGTGDSGIQGRSGKVGGNSGLKPGDEYKKMIGKDGRYQMKPEDEEPQASAKP